MQCLLLVEVGSMPKAAEEGEVAFKTNILNQAWDTCLHLILDHLRASHEVTRTRLHTRVRIERLYHLFQIRHTKAVEVQH